jgi:hypothetical protein
VSFTLAAMAGGENFSRKGKRVLWPMCLCLDLWGHMCALVSLCTTQIVVELYLESQHKAKETGICGHHCSHRMESNFVLINRKLFFSQLKLENKVFF